VGNQGPDYKSLPADRHDFPSKHDFPRIFQESSVRWCNLENLRAQPNTIGCNNKEKKVLLVVENKLAVAGGAAYR
jgi:hypothetical protein